MKTITLTDEAYSRLAEWKTSSQDSFSKVVSRIVPKKGTLGQLVQDMKALPSLTEKQAKTMEAIVRESRDVSREKDPWTS